jgi:enoyl-CoA hydratase/carnithine racemase
MSQPQFETLLYSVEDGIATLTLNRPEKMNAFTTQMRDDLVAAFDATDADDAVRVVIITGAAQGIGAACARRVVQDGAAVALWDLADEAGTALAAEINAARKAASDAAFIAAAMPH